MKLKNKVALVTGGGRGIGRAIAEALAQEGARVVVTAAREKAEIDEVARRIGGNAVLSDVTDPESVRGLVESVLSLHSRIDILVNNAARGMRYVNEAFMTDPKPFWEADQEAWRMVIDTNVSGVFLVTRTVVPHMITQGSGRIINISINETTMRRKGFSPYGPSKAALESMSAIWSQELEGTGVTLNLLLPGGATNTGMIPETFPENRRNELIDPAIVGPPAVYLASDEAAGINGERLIALSWKGGIA